MVIFSPLPMSARGLFFTVYVPQLKSQITLKQCPHSIATRISAPIELCFDLARDIDLHIQSTEGTDERAVAGVTSGMINLGEEVTWEARHFGSRQKLTSRITIFDRPNHFRDSQVSGGLTTTITSAPKTKRRSCGMSLTMSRRLDGWAAAPL